jgi:GNAT superfamily N-acetyltransferase
MLHVQSLENSHLPQIQALVNSHLSAIVPGWALPTEYIASRLTVDPDEYIIDPWVIERRTLVVVERGSVSAAAHLLRYGNGPEVSKDYNEAGEMKWFLAWPEAADSASTLLEAVKEQMRRWQVRNYYAGNNLPVPLAGGLPDVWPHIGSFLERAGFYTEFTGTEAIYGGDLPVLDPQSNPPIPGIRIERHVDRDGPCFKVFHGEEEAGSFSVATDLSKGGQLPALLGWGELADIQISENWRNRGLGSWLMGHVVSWLRLAGCSRVVFSVGSENESLGADRFYCRFGWNVLVRLKKGWQHNLSQ